MVKGSGIIVEYNSNDKGLEREANNMIQEIKDVSEKNGDGLYNQMVEELSDANKKNEIESMKIISAYYKKLLPLIRE